MPRTPVRYTKKASAILATETAESLARVAEERKVSASALVRRCVESHLPRLQSRGNKEVST